MATLKLINTVMHKPNSIFEAARQILTEGAPPAIDQKALAKFQKNLDGMKWKASKGDDPEDTAAMTKAVESNKKLLLKVLDLYKNGKWKAAYRVADDLDSSAQDQIPVAIFDAIAEA